MAFRAMSAAWRDKFSRAGAGAGSGASARGGGVGASSYDASASAAFFEGLAAACYAAAWQLSVGIGSSAGTLAASSVAPQYVDTTLELLIT